MYGAPFGFSLHGAASAIYATRDPFRLDMPEHYRSLLWTMPRAAMPSLPHPERFTARTLVTRSGIPRLISQLMRDISQLDTAAEGPALARLGMPMAEMVVLALEAELAGIPATPSPNGQLLGRIKARIMEHIDVFEVDVAQIADNLGVGIRTLNRMFAAEGTTAMQWLWQERLRNSYRLQQGGAGVGRGHFIRLQQHVPLQPRLQARVRHTPQHPREERAHRWVSQSLEATVLWGNDAKIADSTSPFRCVYTSPAPIFCSK